MRIYSKFILIFFVCLVSACKTTIPIPQYNEVPINSLSNKSSIESVELAILKAATSLGWQTQKISDGKMEATLDIRKHQLNILLSFDKDTVSVDYLDSKNLKYSGTRIHRQYANWVSNLLREIKVQHLNID